MAQFLHLMNLCDCWIPHLLELPCDNDRRVIMGLLKLLFLAFIVLAVLGYFRSWYRIVRKRDPITGRTKYELSFNSSKVREDAHSARASVSEAFTSEPPRDDIVHGTIVSIVANPDTVTILEPNRRNVSVEVPPYTNFRFYDGPGALTDLHLGDNAAVNYRVEHGKNVAQVVTVDRNR